MSDTDTDGAAQHPGAELADRSGELSLLVDATDSFYRAEMDRVTTWRTRLDQTTNWAVVVMAAILTFAFAGRGNPHYVLLVGVLAVGVFLLVEAQRFQEYDTWRSRVRVLQVDLYGEIYDHRGPETPAWRSRLSDDLRDPTIDVSLPLALGHRLQHVYLPLLTVVLAAWWLRVTAFEAGASWRETAAVGGVPGPVVAAAVCGAYLLAVGLAGWSARHFVRREFDVDAADAGSDADPSPETN